METKNKDPARPGEKAAKPAALSAALMARKGSATPLSIAGSFAGGAAAPPPPTSSQASTSQASTAGSDSPRQTAAHTGSLEVRHCSHADIACLGEERRPEPGGTVYVARRVVDNDAKAEAATAPRARGKTILVVEDYQLSSKLFCELLEIAGYRTLQTSDGVAAYEMTKTHKPDLILMDVRLPEVSGLEVVQWIRQDPELRQTPIIAVTAFAMEGDEARILSAGCNAYLRKPISIAGFMATIQGFLGDSETKSG